MASEAKRRRPERRPHGAGGVTRKGDDSSRTRRSCAPRPQFQFLPMRPVAQRSRRLPRNARAHARTTAHADAAGWRSCAFLHSAQTLVRHTMSGTGAREDGHESSYRHTTITCRVRLSVTENRESAFLSLRSSKWEFVARRREAIVHYPKVDLTGNGRRTSGLGPRTSDLRAWTSDPGPANLRRQMLGWGP